MKCKVCGTEFEDAAYCPMCGAKAGIEIDKAQEEPKDIKQEKNGDIYYKYHSADPDATVVLTAKDAESYQKEKEDHEESAKRVVLQESFEEKKSHKKMWMIILIIAICVVVIAGGIAAYYFLIYRNRILYNTADIYYTTDEKVEDLEGFSVTIGSHVQDTITNSDYDSNQFVFENKKKKTVAACMNETLLEQADDAQVSKTVVSQDMSTVYYFSGDAAMDLYCMSGEKVTKVQSDIHNLISAVVSKDGSYMVYSCKKAEDAYIMYEVLASGEINQVSVSETPIQALYVTEKGKIYCATQKKTTDDTEKVTYQISDLQDKRDYGSELSEIKYFGYYEKLDAYLVETIDGDIYYVDMDDNGTENLIATGADWLTDASEVDAGQNSCDRENRISEQLQTTMVTMEPCILYFKEGNLYWNDVVNSGQSVKVAENVTDINSIEMWNQSDIYFRNQNALYQVTKSGEAWGSVKKIAEACDKYEYIADKKKILYLSDGTLYEYAKGNQSEVAKHVCTFDVDQENGTYAYNTDSAVYYVKGNSEKEYPVRAKDEIYLLNKNIYYVNQSDELVSFSMKEKNETVLAKKVNEVFKAWK